VLSYESENTGQERSGALTELKLTTSETVTLHVGAVYQVLLCMFWCHIFSSLCLWTSRWLVFGVSFQYI